jgi:hypothetical protein
MAKKKFESLVRLEKLRSGSIGVVNCCRPWGRIESVDEETSRKGKLIHAVGISVRVLQEGGQLRVRRKGNLIVIRTVFKI